MPESFLLLRHGATDWNAKNRIQGRADNELNDLGRKQARAAIECLRRHKVKRIISSDLRRAVETAWIVNKGLDIPLHIDRRLSERDFGAIEGKTGGELKEPEAAKYFVQPEIIEADGKRLPKDAEPLEKMDPRVLTAVHGYLRKHPGETLLFITHKGVQKSLCRSLVPESGHPPSLNGVPQRFERNGDGWRVTELSAG